jgi:hypothetical protein
MNFKIVTDCSNLKVAKYCATLLRNAGEDSSLGCRLVAAQSLCRMKQQLFSASGKFFTPLDRYTLF